MIEDRSADIRAMRDRVSRMAEYLRVESKRDEIASLETRAAEPGFWDDPGAAQQVMAQVAGLKDDVAAYDAIV
ncbi:MAG: peptide chain release factor 2, partial [Actinobacteria bacterium]